MGFEGKEVILVQFRYGHKSLFYVVDLQAQKMVRIPSATLYNESGRGCTVRLGSVIYNVGGEDDTESFEFRDGDDTKQHIHLSASILELNEEHLTSLLNEGDNNASLCNQHDNDYISTLRWKGGVAPLNYRRLFVSSVVLGGNIYVCGGHLAAPHSIGEVFMPEYGHWKLLPPPPQDVIHVDHRACISSPVISDEANGRLLVHFPTARALYAFYPDTETWHCIDQNYFYQWGRATALFDGVLYSHVKNKTTPDCLVAYDLFTKSRLDVVYSSQFPALVYVSPFVNMLHMGNDVLCLANSYPFYNEDKSPPRKADTNIQFVKFRVKRTSPTEVRVTPVATNCFPLERYWRAIRFIAL